MTQSEIAICLIKVPVSSLEEAVQFYGKLFGKDLDFAAAEYGWAQYTVGDLPFCLYQEGMGGGRGQAGTADTTHFAVSDLQATYETLTQSGLTIPQGIETSASGGSFFDIEDPDGNLFKFLQR